MSTNPAGSAPAPEPVSRDSATESSPATSAPAAEAHPVSPARRRRLVAWTVVLAAVVLAADQLTKWWAESALTEGADPIPLLGDLLSLRLIYNPGAALSILSGTGMTWILTIVVVAVVVVIVRAIGRIGSRGWAVALGLLLGGALGNLGDRLFRDPGFAHGKVVDFIDYAGFFVGNVADIAIVVAAGLVVILTFRGTGLDGRRQTDEPQDARREGPRDERGDGEG
ncbi:signal peptidase II [Isoptericola sp. BMS4]|uniref:signal peptidase II n=1 Tax=Isoptericola sp. BMS4 TaxID=2527875 RepID=UPI00141EE7F7|nr:signal peptidase II [Isoptericola sp. BMS4]